jgi:signal transduction histidine kinase
VRKHAGARRTVVGIDVEDGTLVVRVADDGRGLATPPASPADWPHYGLQAMRERAAAIGGSVEWSDGAGSGVVVRIAVPVAGGG